MIKGLGENMPETRWGYARRGRVQAQWPKEDGAAAAGRNPMQFTRYLRNTALQLQAEIRTTNQRFA